MEEERNLTKQYLNYLVECIKEETTRVSEVIDSIDPKDKTRIYFIRKQLSYILHKSSKIE